MRPQGANIPPIKSLKIKVSRRATVDIADEPSASANQKNLSEFDFKKDSKGNTIAIPKHLNASNEAALGVDGVKKMPDL